MCAKDWQAPFAETDFDPVASFASACAPRTTANRATNLNALGRLALDEAQERRGHTEILENFAKHVATLKGRKS